jgi:hypothetical protein
MSLHIAGKVAPESFSSRELPRLPEHGPNMNSPALAMV